MQNEDEPKTPWWAKAFLILFVVILAWALVVDCWDIPGLNPYCGPEWSGPYD